MIDAGWMLVVLVVAALAYRRVGVDTKYEQRLKKLEEAFSEWPKPEALLEQIDDLGTAVDSITSDGASFPAVVQRANEITKDMLEVKRLVADHDQKIAALRSKGAFTALSGG